MSDSTAVEAYDPEQETGLEDFDTTRDATVPRIRIVHNEGVFLDSQTKEKFESLDVILLGLVKQRILWDPEVDDDAKPLCKSYEFTIGRPDARNFPWEKAGFDQGDAEATATDGVVALPCDGCGLKEWGTDPKGGKAPWCTEQHTYPLLVVKNYDPDTGMYEASPAILTVQKTGIKPSKTYCTPFARSKTPLYSVRTTLSLTQERRGSVTYSTPEFTKGIDTDRSEWPSFAQMYRSMREFLHTPPSRRDADEGGTGTAVKAPTGTGQTAAATTDDDDEEIPF